MDKVVTAEIERGEQIQGLSSRLSWWVGCGVGENKRDLIGLLVPFTEMGSLRKEPVSGGESETHFAQALFEMPVRHPDGNGKPIVGQMRILGAQI